MLPPRDTAPIPRPSTEGTRRAGRTLFEIMATLAVIGLAAVLAAPVVRPLARQAREPQRTATALVRLLEHARLTAATSRSNVLVAVNLRTGRVWTTISPGRGEARRSASVLDIGAGVTAESGGELARFTLLPDGAVLGAPVRFRGPRGTVVVAPNSLAVEVHHAAR